MPTRSRLEGLNRTHFHPGQRLCVALSGGADSTALLIALLEANAEKDSLGLVLTAIHVHHGLRGPEADGDEAFVRTLCTQNNVPLTVTHVDTPARQQAEREGLEEAARELRYAAFRHLLATGAADALATAHTLEDQAETVIMKLLRGAWTDGLSGIAPALDMTSAPPASTVPSQPVRWAGAPGAYSEGQPAGPTRSANRSQREAPLLRPMLDVRRAEVERFLNERNQPWRDDSSNQDLSLTRNRVRHDLMPLLRSFNPALDATLARTAAIARDEEDFWRRETARLLPSMVLPGKPVRGGGRAVATGVGETSIAIEIERLKAQPTALQRRLVRAAAASLGCRPDADDTSKLLALAGLLQLPGLTSRNGARLDLGNGLRAERSIRELRLSRITSPAIPKKV